ncbi:MAG: peptidylprolyl isomerase [Candidatus Magasanikbacteria bacterium]|nr:peptidylprolyl isomerase [Candidatus Magasanikbacteria bacterium]
METKNEQQNMKMFGYGLAGVLAVALLGSVVCGVYRVYAKAATDNFTFTVAKVLRLPAMKVNGERVLYSDYAEDLRAIHTLVAYDKSTGGNNAALTPEQMSDQVLWRLANNILIKEAAAKYGVSASAQDIDTIKANLLKQFKDENEINAEISKRYGWTFAQYQEKVVKNYILQQKIAEKIQGDQSGREAIRNKALTVLNEIKGGKDFAAEAKLYGEDGTKANGGDLGWFGKGDMVPEFEKAVFALKPGEMTQDLIETQYGYHIIKLDEVKTGKAKDASGKMVDQQKVHARHILFKFPDPTTYMDSLAKSASFNLYLKVHNPFTDLLKK